jgi:16S rRNA (guanine1516-N2)-methyltransferase
MARNPCLPEQTNVLSPQGPLSSSAGFVFFSDRSDNPDYAQSILASLPAAQLTQDSDSARFHLILTKDHLEIRLNTQNAPGPVLVDFNSGRLQWRRGQGELISRAFGISKLTAPHLLDTTAGLGQDAFVLASKGCSVTLLERSPVIAALLYDGLVRATHVSDTAEITARMRLIREDAIHFLNTSEESFDFIYLDPMYPARTKSAQSRKEMHLLQELLDPRQNDAELLTLARQKAGKRVVVKRPLKAGSLGQQKPSYSISGKNVRFDVYVN